MILLALAFSPAPKTFPISAICSSSAAVFEAVADNLASVNLIRANFDFAFAVNSALIFAGVFLASIFLLIFSLATATLASLGKIKESPNIIVI